MPQLKPRLHAIMVTYRRRDAAAATVAALLAQTRPPDTITIVDNDADPLVESIARRLGVRYVAQPDNGGPAGAIAAGVAYVPGELFSASGMYRNCLRLNCGNPHTPEIENAVRRLGELLAA